MAGLALATAILFYGFNIDVFGIKRDTRKETVQKNTTTPVTPAIPEEPPAGPLALTPVSTPPEADSESPPVESPTADPVPNAAEVQSPPSEATASDPTGAPPAESRTPEPSAERKEPAAVTKAEMPSAEQQEAARKVMRDVYGDDIDGAKTAAEKSKLAKVLLGVGRSKKDTAKRIVLYEQAAELAAGGADVETAMQAADAMVAEISGVDPIATKQPLLQKAAVAAARNKEQQTAVARAILDLADAAIVADKLDAADELLMLAASSSRTAGGDKLLEQRAAVTRKRWEYLNARVTEYAKHLDSLSSDPTNPAANLFVGRYVLFGKRQREGFDYLAKGDDEDLKEQADMELAGRLTADEAYHVAEKWRALAEKAEQYDRQVMLELALARYKECETGLSGLDRASATKQIAALTKAGIGDAPQAESAGPMLPPLTEPWREVARLTGHKRQVCTVAISPDSTMAATGGGDGVVRVWDLNAYKLKCELRGHAGQIGRVAFVPKSPLLLSVGYDGYSHIWDVSAGKETEKVKLSDAVPLAALAVDGTGSFAVAGDDKGRVAKVNLKDLSVARPAEQHEARVADIAISPDGKRIASAGWDRVIVWDADDLRVLHKLDAQHGFHDICFALKGSRLLACNLDGIHVWETTKGQLLGVVKVGDGGRSGNDGHIQSLAPLDDGRLILAGGFDGKVYCVEMRTGSTLATLPWADGIMEQVAVSPDQTTMVLANGDHFEGGWKYRDDSYAPVWELSVGLFSHGKK